MKVLWVQERNPDILSFSLRKSWEVNPLQRYPFTGHFYISLDISLSQRQGPKEGVSLHVPQKQGPYGNRHPFQSLTSHIFWGPK
jgi:hypothetical protein